MCCKCESGAGRHHTGTDAEHPSCWSWANWLGQQTIRKHPKKGLDTCSWGCSSAAPGISVYSYKSVLISLLVGSGDLSVTSPLSLSLPSALIPRECTPLNAEPYPDWYLGHAVQWSIAPALPSPGNSETWSIPTLGRSSQGWDSHSLPLNVIKCCRKACVT